MCQTMEEGLFIHYFIGCSARKSEDPIILFRLMRLPEEL
eukprot:IDg17098t1